MRHLSPVTVKNRNAAAKLRVVAKNRNAAARLRVVAKNPNVGAKLLVVAKNPNAGAKAAAVDVVGEAGGGGGGGGGGGFFSSCFGDCFSDAHERTKIGGWAQIGYHSAGSPLRFNNYPDGVRLHQAYLYYDEVADGSKGLSFGKRIDYVYGIDGPDTQSFGQGGGWDSGWDNGAYYGHALPQAYGTVAYGDTEVKIGHFYTLIGYEVVTATGNFFYSHSYTMYNSEPFTHTGALVTHKVKDNLTLYGGYVTGWDSGFRDNGDAFLGGATLKMCDDVSVTYAGIGGRFNEESSRGSIPINERGYMQSVIITTQLTEKLQHVFWTDYLDSKDEVGDTVRNTFDITNYLIYNICDKLSVGSRFEWWNVADTANDGNKDVYAFTFGANVRPVDHLLVRPEIRWDGDQDRQGVNEIDARNGLARTSQVGFGIDAIVSF
jgi:hypothetical protein